MAVRRSVVTEKDLQSRLEEYEGRYGVSSEHLADAFRRNGHLDETEDFRGWSMTWSPYQLVTANGD